MTFIILFITLKRQKILLLLFAENNAEKKKR